MNEATFYAQDPGYFHPKFVICSYFWTSTVVSGESLIYGIFIFVASPPGPLRLSVMLTIYQRHTNDPWPWVSHLSGHFNWKHEILETIMSTSGTTDSLCVCVVAILDLLTLAIFKAIQFDLPNPPRWYDRTWWPLNTTDPTVHKSRFAAEWENAQTYQSVAAAASSVHCVK